MNVQHILPNHICKYITKPVSDKPFCITSQQSELVMNQKFVNPFYTEVVRRLYRRNVDIHMPIKINIYSFYSLIEYVFDTHL